MFWGAFKGRTGTHRGVNPRPSTNQPVQSYPPPLLSSTFPFRPNLTPGKEGSNTGLVPLTGTEYYHIHITLSRLTGELLQKQRPNADPRHFFYSSHIYLYLHCKYLPSHHELSLTFIHHKTHHKHHMPSIDRSISSGLDLTL